MAGFAELGEQFAKMPRQHKIAGGVVLMGLLGAGFYFLFYAAISEEVAGLENQITQLQGEKASYEEKKQKYMAFRAEVEKLLQEKKELVKVLPSRSEVPSFLQSLHSKAELSGLTITTFDKGEEIVRDFYAEIPVKMTITGTYHQIIHFFYSVGKLKRIVNIQDVMLTDPKPGPEGMMLKAQFTASTFRFIERAAGAPQPG